MKFLNFFLFLWAIFALLDPDPNRIRIQIQNTDKQLYFSQHIIRTVENRVVLFIYYLSYIHLGSSVCHPVVLSYSCHIPVIVAER
jgi:SUMO ligase MMS21 Smc5/6 complex component